MDIFDTLIYIARVLLVFCGLLLLVAAYSKISRKLRIVFQILGFGSVIIVGVYGWFNLEQVYELLRVNYFTIIPILSLLIILLATDYIISLKIISHKGFEKYELNEILKWTYKKIGNKTVFLSPVVFTLMFPALVMNLTIAVACIVFYFIVVTNNLKVLRLAEKGVQVDS